MKSLFFICLSILFLSCHRNIAKTYDFILFKQIVNHTEPNHISPKISHDHIYASGIKWVNINFEGHIYQLPEYCDSADLVAFFNEKKLEPVEVQTPEQRNQDSKKTIGQKVAIGDSNPQISKESPKVVQYTFLKFIDNQRVVFVSNNKVKYANIYSPVIKNEKFKIDLVKSKRFNPYQRGYYFIKDDTTLIVELRQYRKEPSKKLIFTIHNENLILRKIVTYKEHQKKNTKEKQQFLESEFDLSINYPDIVNLPLSYKIDKEIDFNFKELKIESIEDGLSSLQGHNNILFFDHRLYHFKDSILLENFEYEKCITW
ncbi:MAG: hypothetical protein ABIO44_04630 [Saprospiraceae bacterium]